MSINILTLFNAIYSIALHHINVKRVNVYDVVRAEKKNVTVFFSICIVLIYIFFFGYSKPEIAGERGAPSPLYEYSVLLFILLFYYTGNDKKFVCIASIFVLAFSLQEMIFGGRIIAMQFMLVAYLMYFVKKISFRVMSIMGVCMLMIFTAIGVLRGALLSAKFSADEIFSSFLTGGFALDTAYSAYNTSQTFVIAAEGISEPKKLEYTISWLRSFVFGESSNYEHTLPMISEQFGFHSFGGVYPFYFYFYFGILGVLGSVVLIYPYLKTIASYKSDFTKCVSVFFVCYTFRWYLYNPLGLIRSFMFLAILYWGVKTFHRITKHKRTQLNINLKSYD